MRLIAAVMLLSGALGAQQQPTPLEIRKAKTLLATQLACLGCHELDGQGGRSAPSLTTVGERRSASYIRAMIEDPQRTLPGTAMPKIVAPAPVRELIVRLVAAGARGPETPPIVAPSALPAAANGAALYTKWCASCHGAAGQGDGPNAKYLPVLPAKHGDGAAMRGRPDDSLYDVIAVGGPPYGRSARMPAFGATLTPPEIRQLVAHIRTLCRCQGPSWSRPGKAP